MPDNGAPYAVPHLDEMEHKYLKALLAASGRVAETALEDVASMPSSDPRANSRALLLMAATADIAMTNELKQKMDEALANG